MRPKGRDHFTLEDVSRGFSTVVKCSAAGGVSPSPRWFPQRPGQQVARADGKEPSFEPVLRTMYQAGFRGDIYPAPAMWRSGHVGVFPYYPFPEGVERMRAGSS